jgi:hypothetical protein
MLRKTASRLFENLPIFASNIAAEDRKKGDKNTYDRQDDKRGNTDH